jgi:hypothetical protein
MISKHSIDSNQTGKIIIGAMIATVKMLSGALTGKTFDNSMEGLVSKES